MIRADIRFADGSIRRCVGGVRDGEPYYWQTKADVHTHVDRVNRAGKGDIEVVRIL